MDPWSVAHSFARAGGQAVHFGGDEGEAAAGLAGPRGLERAVECEQVAAIGDLPDLVEQRVG